MAKGKVFDIRCKQCSKKIAESNGENLIEFVCPRCGKKTCIAIDKLECSEEDQDMPSKAWSIGGDRSNYSSLNAWESRMQENLVSQDN